MTGRQRAGRTVAFVFGGGGVLGACEAGMVAALLDAGVQPDLVVGTSVGALNGVAVAADPAPGTAGRLVTLWSEMDRYGVFGGSWFRRVGTLARSRTHLHPVDPLRSLLERELTARRFDQLAVPFQCVAASIERATERWFDAGELLPAVLASCAVPGLLAPVLVDGEHYIDGGIVNSIPVGRAAQLGADVIYVLHVGRIEQPLHAPRWPWEVGLVAFEVARRHRFFTDLAALPRTVQVHVLPTGTEPTRFTDLANLRYRDFRRIGDSVDRAREATARYLAARAEPTGGRR